MAFLRHIDLRGFKSIRAMELELRPLNVLVGVNGAGKSNLVAFFKMINEMMGERLQDYIATSGRAQTLLHFGPKTTTQIEATLTFDTDSGVDTYVMRLFHVAGDTLVFAEELLRFQSSGFQGPPKEMSLGSGHQETGIHKAVEDGDQTAKVFRHILNHCRVFHFHDTSPTAGVRQFCCIGDDRWLRPDAANLAAILHRLRNQDEGPAYRRIVGTVRRIAPFFADFELEPTGPGGKDIILNWRQNNSAQIFGPHQLSDGTLRAIALVTLLLQPVEDLPSIIIIDEPELGLHPAAKNLLAGLLQKASHHCQVIVATQSSSLLDAFDTEDVVVVDRDDRESTFRRLDESSLQDWIKQYTLGELWEKNVIGGGPF